MTISRSVCTLLLLSLASFAQAGSLYLPMHLSPEIERRVDELFLLAGMPQVKKPIPVKLVHKAMTKAERKHPTEVSKIRHYLERYSNTASLTHVSVSLSNPQDFDSALANQRGLGIKSRYQVSANAYWAINDNIAVNIGGIAGERDGERDEFAEGTFLSVGTDWLQADIGYRAHWWSPMQDSAMLISTQAAAMPGITFSNVEPISGLGFSYEVFMQQMSKSDKIKSQDGTERLEGNPRLFGLHLGFSPFNNFNLGINRLMQYGGADRDDSFKDLMKAFFQPSQQDNSGDQGLDFGNQLSSITVAYSFEHLIPVGLSMEYAGEDTSEGQNGMLGNTSLLFGLNLPQIGEHLSLNWEHGEWQNAWYVNSNYGDGLTQWAAILGHWGAEYREPGHAVGATTDSLKMHWDFLQGTELGFNWRQVANQCSTEACKSVANYKDGYEYGLELNQAHGELILNLSLSSGQTVFGDSFGRISGGIRW